MKKIFKQIGVEIFSELHVVEEASLQLFGEDTIYIRYNSGQVRQNTQVHQYSLTLVYKKGKKVLHQSWSMIADASQAIEEAKKYLYFLREQAVLIAESPFEPEMSNHGKSDVDHKGNLPSQENIFQDIHDACQGTDFCGLVASGKQVTAIQNSKGQFHWFSKESFFVDYSLYFGERAVKAFYAGSDWSPQTLKENIQQSAQHLEIMKRPMIKLKPGTYRVFLEPVAVAELVGYLAFSSFSFRNFKSGDGLWIELAHERKSLSPLLNFRENFDLGFVPLFNKLGELSTAQVPLIEKGQLKNWLVSTASAKEFSVETNHASPSEYPRSLEILPGTLKRDEILSQLGTGLYLGNLHYVNASDQKSARLTGMTRFAAFWVEKGKIVGPIDNLRFDESLYQAWGPNLLALTAETEIIPDTSTYGARALSGNKLPGMLIDQFSFTL